MPNKMDIRRIIRETVDEYINGLSKNSEDKIVAIDPSQNLGIELPG